MPLFTCKDGTPDSDLVETLQEYEPDKAGGHFQKIETGVTEKWAKMETSVLNVPRREFVASGKPLQ